MKLQATGKNVTILTDAVIDIYINKGGAVVSLQADLYDCDCNLIYCHDKRRYAYDGESTLNDFIKWYLYEMAQGLLYADGIGIGNYTLKKHYI